MDKKYIWLILVILILVGGFLILGTKKQINPPKELVVGAIFPLTGSTAQFGELFRQGLDASLKDSKNIKIIYEDSGGDAARGVTAFQKLVNVDKVDIVLPIISKVAAPLVPLMREQMVPGIMSLVATNSATSKDNNYVYRLFWTADETGIIFAQRIIDAGFTNVGLLQAKNEVSQSNIDVIRPLLEKAGVKVSIETFQDPDTDFKTQLSKLKSENIQALGILTIPPVSMKNIITQTKQLDINIPLYDILSVFLNPGVPEMLGSLANNIYTIATPYLIGDYKKDFKDQYQSQTGKELTGYSSIGYDMGTLLKYLVDQKAFDRNSITQVLADMKSFEGISSPYIIDDMHNIKPTISKAQYINGVIQKSEK